jgi:3-oxoacyl-[acyl-carrier-protein] synthase II
VKITFVYPRFEKFLTNNPELDKGLIDYFLGDFTTPPSLGIPILASLTPPEHEIELVDDNAGDPVDFGANTDLVAINCFTPQATRAFAIADGFRLRGTKVIMGGFFPSFMAEECLKHAHSVNLGEGEPTWAAILADCRAGSLKRIYKGGCGFNLADMKIPRRDLFYKKDYYDWDEDLVQLTRGCTYNCAMCAIPAHMGGKIRFRPIDKVVAEISQLKYENVYLADDTLFFTQRKMMEYSRSLLEALVPLNKKYFVSSTIALNTDNAFLDLMAAAGVKNFYCTLNVDPVSIRALSGGGRERQVLFDLVKKLADRDINFFASCALGRDWDEKGVSGRIVELLDKAGVHTAEFFIFTPYPGSVHWDRMTSQKRIVDTDWSHYNGAHVVFEPMNMTRDELYREFVTVWNSFYRLQKDSHAASLEPATWNNGKKSVGKPLARQGVKGQAVVSGIGLLSPIGNTPAAVLENLRHGRHGIAPITRFDASCFRTDLGGEIRGFDPGLYLDKEEIAEYDDRYLQYAIASARMALIDAGLRWNVGAARRDIALVLGTCNGGLLSAEQEYKWLHGGGGTAFDEKMNLQAQYYGFGKALARALGIGGETWIVTTACSSTTGAAGLAASLVNLGLYSTVVLGGSDSLCRANMSGFNGLKAVSTGRTAPFSLPVGLNIGEAAAFWVVEEMETALLRHARLYGTIAGHSLTSDAYHPTSPDPRGDGVFRTLTNALRDAGIPASDIGCINAHGTGTEANDRAETKGIAKFLQDNGCPPQVPVTSTKSYFGHCMGTTGLLEATCNLLAMRDGFVPPTLNFSVPRPGCTLDYVPNIPLVKDYPAFISANYAFGGNNAAVVVTKWDTPVAARKKTGTRVVITGAGCVTSLGLGVEATLAALRAQVRGYGPAARLKTESSRSKHAGLVAEFKASDVDRRLDLSGMNLISRYATAASRLALDAAGLKVGRANADDVGIVMGVSNGPPEDDHMNSVFSTPDSRPDINCFSNITANSTAGWVSNALCLRGENMTLAPGPHAGIASCAYAFNALLENRAVAMLACGSDEVYYRMFHNYDMIGFLKQDAAETGYRMDLVDPKRKVIAEGAASLVFETLDNARLRGAAVLAEMLSYAMNVDGTEFSGQSLSASGLAHACDTALARAGIAWKDIGCAVWAPQGNAQDKKVLDVLQSRLWSVAPGVPLAGTTFNTGYIETASILVGVACTLAAFREGAALWPQITGIPEIDKKEAGAVPDHILVLASTDLGYNFAMVLRNGDASASTTVGDASASTTAGGAS